MNRMVAWTGGAAIAAGLLLGYIAERLNREAALSRESPAAPRLAESLPPVASISDTNDTTDVLERYRAAAAV